MRMFMLVVAVALSSTACRSKSTNATASSGSSTGSAASAAAGSGSAVAEPGSGAVGSGSAVAEPGSAAAGSALGSADEAAAGSGSAGSAAIDPKIAALSPEERRTCGIYATCKVEGLRDDDPQAEAKKPQFMNECLAAWVKLSKKQKKEIAECADAQGACMGPPPCFDDMKLDK